MKKTQIIIFIFLFLGVSPVWAIAINCDKNLQFGMLLPAYNNIPTYATIQINSDNLDIPLAHASPSSTQMMPNYEEPQRGRCIITGKANSIFNVVVIPQNTSPNTLTYLYKASDQLDNKGQQTIYIGGRLNLASLTSGKNKYTINIDATCAAENPNC